MIICYTIVNNLILHKILFVSMCYDSTTEDYVRTIKQKNQMCIMQAVLRLNIKKLFYIVKLNWVINKSNEMKYDTRER